MGESAFWNQPCNLSTAKSDFILALHHEPKMYVAKKVTSEIYTIRKEQEFSGQPNPKLSSQAACAESLGASWRPPWGKGLNAPFPPVKP